MSEIFDKIKESIPKHRRRFTRMSMDIAAQIYSYMKSKNDMTQKKLAKELNKKESEISKWLRGNHNFTIETIAKIEAIFDKNIVLVPMYALEDLGFRFDTSNTYIEMSNTLETNPSWKVKPSVSSNSLEVLKNIFSTPNAAKTYLPNG